MRRLAAFGALAVGSARFHWRTGLGTAAGMTVAAAVLAAALLVGDSARWTLRRLGLARLGRTTLAMDSGGRFFRESLASDLAGNLDATAVAALRLKGTAGRDTPGGGVPGAARRVEVLGVDDSFWRLAGESCRTPGPDEVAVNRRLAAELGVRAGDELSLRIGQPTLLPRDAPLASRQGRLSRGFRLKVALVVSAGQLGDFNLAADQVAPRNVFVGRAWLQERLGLAGRANVLLVGPAADGRDPSPEAAGAALRAAWRLEHAGVRVAATPADGVLRAQSDRVFLDPAIGRAALGEAGAVGALAYLVNSIRRDAPGGERRTPYSFAVACSPSADSRLSPVPPGMKDDEILLNRWTADRLGAAEGDSVTLDYSQLLPSGDFARQTRAFKVRGVIGMDDAVRERSLMPDFPGLTDVESCREWDIGLPTDERDLRDPDNEAYWNAYRAAPKAVVTLAAGRRMWANRFGDLTAVRFAGAAEQADGIASAVARRMDPADAGFLFAPVRDLALRAAAQGVDIGGLFLGMSAFLVAAALMLAGLLFAFGVQGRSEELGMLLAVGYRPAQVRLLLLMEGAVPAVAGAAAGTALGPLLARLLLGCLRTFWKDAVAGAAIAYHAGPLTQAVAFGAGVLCCVAAILAAAWRQGRRAPLALLQADLEAEPGPPADRRGPGRGLAMALAAAVAAAAVAAWSARADPRYAAGGFFGAGALMLAAGMGAAAALLGRLGAASPGRLTLAGLGMRNAARRPGRSLATVGLLACGGFMVVSVSSMREDFRAHAGERWSGTGGFALVGETAAGIPDPPGGARGRKAFGLEGEAALRGARIVSMRVREGDDASCLNLNRAQAPRLVGVDPEEFSRLGAFLDGRGGDVWRLLSGERADGIVPGIAGDLNTAAWALQMRVGPDRGDVLEYADERGNRFRVKLVAALPVRLSVFQGAVLVSGEALARMYPSDAGYRMFLVDGPPGGDAAAAREALSRRMEGAGLELEPCVERLERFGSVESAYLAMFLALGGLGLLLGTVGVGIVALRNVLERRGELGALRCMGFAAGQVARVVAAEYRFLLLCGVAAGAASSLVAIWPSLTAPGARVPVGAIAAVLGGALVLGLAWVGVAARLAARGPLLRVLRNE